jgi:oxaloacetate decarboxylase (Na+ extruding) subunit gamma
MQSTLLDKGIELMLVGMGTVFVFLTLLVIMMTVMAQVIMRLTPAAEEAVSDEEVAAISAAIAQHRNRNS